MLCLRNEVQIFYLGRTIKHKINKHKKYPNDFTCNDVPANIFAAACNGSKANAGECGKTNHYDTRRRTNKSSEIHRSIVEGGSVKEINFKNHRALENITCITEKMNLMPYAYSYNEKEQKGIFNIVTKNT